MKQPTIDVMEQALTRPTSRRHIASFLAMATGLILASFDEAEAKQKSRAKSLRSRNSDVYGAKLDENLSAAKKRCPKPCSNCQRCVGKKCKPKANGTSCGAGKTCRNGKCGAQAGGTQLRIEAAVRDLTVNRNDGTPLPFTPLHPQITAEVTLTDLAGESTVFPATVIFTPSLAAFVGTVSLPASVTPGPYLLAIKFRERMRTKRAQANGIVTILAGATANAPRITLIPGDVNDDNILTNADYDEIASCYTFPDEPETCSGLRFIRTDLDDNGTVNEFDLNLYLRALGA